MNSILFECHDLYYLPNFMPIIEEFQRRGGYRLALSVPTSRNRWEFNRVKQAAEELGTDFIQAPAESKRTQQIRKATNDVIIVGNIGQLDNNIVDLTKDDVAWILNETYS